MMLIYSNLYCPAIARLGLKHILNLTRFLESFIMLGCLTRLI